MPCRSGCRTAGPARGRPCRPPAPRRTRSPHRPGACPRSPRVGRRCRGAAGSRHGRGKPRSPGRRRWPAAAAAAPRSARGRAGRVPVVVSPWPSGRWGSHPRPPARRRTPAERGSGWRRWRPSSGRADRRGRPRRRRGRRRPGRCRGCGGRRRVAGRPPGMSRRCGGPVLGAQVALERGREVYARGCHTAKRTTHLCAVGALC